MPRKMTGSVWVNCGGTFCARLTVPTESGEGKTRRSFHLPTCRSEEQAAQRTRLLADVVYQTQHSLEYEALMVIVGKLAAASDREMGRVARNLDSETGGVLEAAALGSFESVTAYARSWIAERRRRGINDAANESSHLGRHVLPLIGDLPMAMVTQDDLMGVAKSLEEKALSGQMSPRTCASVWGTCRRMFKGALDGALRASPADGVPAPLRSSVRRVSSTRLCGGCGTTFVRRADTQKYCSASCRSRYNERRRASGSVGVAMTACALEKVRQEVSGASKDNDAAGGK